MAFDSKRFQAVVTLLKNTDPRVYNEFLRMLDTHVWEVTVAVTQASSAEILQAQGRAQEAQKIMQLLSEFTPVAPTAQPPTTP